MLKEGYKKTELGEIPNEWNIVKTDEILINDKSSIKIGPFGSQLKKEFLIEQGYKVYGQENVFKNDFTLGNRYINKERYEILKSSELKSGDLVISMMGTVGKTAIVPEDIEIGIMDSHLIRLRVDESKYSKELLRQMIQNSPLIKKQIKKLSVGGIMEGLSSTIIKQLKFPLINLKEQEKIAEILSTVDGQIDDTEMLIEKCQELKKGLMQRLLTKGIGHKEFKKTEVGEIPVDWEVKKLEDVSYITMGQSPSSDSYNDKGIGVPFFQGNSEFGNIYPTVKKWCSEPKKIAEPLDILISVRAPVGAVNINNDRACIGRGLASIRQSNKINYMYLYYVLSISQDILNSSAQGSTFTAINSKDLKNFKIAIPSLDEQLKIAQILLSLDNNIEDYKNKKEKLEELKKGLMQQLLTGKIRTSI